MRTYWKYMSSKVRRNGILSVFFVLGIELVLPKVAISQTYSFNDHILNPGVYVNTDMSPSVEDNDTLPEPYSYYDLSSYQTLSTISDVSGNLISWSHGRKIFNSEHLLMQNGDSLIGGQYSVQGSVFVPRPGSDKEVYLFHIADYGEKGGYYTVLNPKGGVNPEMKNIQIHNHTSAGKVMAIRHSNNYDWWVLFFYRIGVSGRVIAFKVTASGVSVSDSVHSVTPTYMPTFADVGESAFSPDGRLFAFVDAQSTSYLIQFNSHTGRFYGQTIKLDEGGEDYQGMGVGFSPYGCKMYISCGRYQISKPVYQFETDVLDSTTIYNSQKIVFLDTNAPNGVGHGHMFAGKDGSLHSPYKNFILRINQPDGDSGKIIIDTLLMKGRINSVQLVAPNIIDKFRTTIRNFTYENQCLPDTTQFYYLDSGTYCVAYDSLRWNFGDPLSGNNTSTEVNPRHLYLEPGEYFVKLFRFFSNETDTISQWVTISENPAFNLPNDTFSCDGNSVGLRINLKNKEYHSFLRTYWNNKENIMFYRVDFPDTVTALVRNQLGCEGKDTTIVHFSELTKGTEKSYTICHEDSLHIPMREGASIVYWDNDSSTTGWSEDQSGTYYLTWKGPFGCTSYDTVIIAKSTELDMSPNADTTICKYESVEFSIPVGAGNILWNSGDTTTQYVTNTEELVSVRFEDSLGCVFTDSAYVTVIDSVPDAGFNLPEEVCSGEDFTLESNGGLSGGTNDYLWVINGTDTFRQQKINLNFNNPGDYTVELVVSDNNGCQDSAKKLLTILAKPLAGFSADDVCNGDSVKLNNNTLVPSGYNVNYQWRFGDGMSSTSTSPVHLYQLINDSVSETFNVTLVARVPDGCTDSVSNPLTVNPSPDPYFEARIIKNDGRFLIDSQATSKTSYTYLWTFGNGNSSTAISPAYTYPNTDSTSYEVCLTVTSDASCASTYCKSIAVVLSARTPLVETIRLLPNPSDGTFRIEGLNEGLVALTLYDTKGALVAELDGADKVYDVSNLAEGLYIIRILTEDASYMKRLRLQ